MEPATEEQGTNSGTIQSTPQASATNGVVPEEKFSKATEQTQSAVPLSTAPVYHTISGGPETLKEFQAKNPPEPIEKIETTFRVGQQNPVQPYAVRPTKNANPSLSVPLTPFIFLIIIIGAGYYFLKVNGVTAEQMRPVVDVFKGIFSNFTQNLIESIKERATL